MTWLQRWLALLALLLPLSCLGQAATESDSWIVEDLACRGNVATSCDFILGHVYLAPGDVVDEDEIGNARLRLASLPSFDSVDIFLEKGSARGRVRIVIEVTESDPYAREWLLGTSARHEFRNQLFWGRLTHQNLFGAGKLLDATMLAYVPLNGRAGSEYLARVQYVDPHWRDSKRTFAIAGLSGGVTDFDNRDEGRLRVKSFGLDLTLGRRIFDFSHLSLLYTYNPVIDVEHRLVDVNGNVEHRADSFDNHTVGFQYGWNSEDDPYFPTRGSRVSFTLVWASYAEKTFMEAGLRKTWTTQNGTSWLVQIADPPRTEYRNTVDEHFDWMAGIARPIAGRGGEVRRGRWYVQAGYETARHQKEYGLKAGVRLETRSFGLVELYVLGSVLDNERSEQ